jgi:hypothetical protein
MTEQWVTMSEAANSLGVPLSQISRLAKNKVIKAKSDTVNRRIRLVDLIEVKALFDSSDYYSGNRGR